MNSKQLAVKKLFSFVLCFLLFVSCDNILNPPKKNHQPVKSGYGRISISFAAGEAARTVFPSTVFDQYTYTFTKLSPATTEGEQNGEVKTPDENGFFTLETGNYTVAVLAYTGDAEPYTLAASGVSSEFSVGPGDNDPVVVSLSMLAAGGQGEFSYTISYPAGATAEITLQKWLDLDDVTLSPARLTEGSGVTETLKLEAGSYLLTILVSKTGLYAGIGEAVYIYSGVTTEYLKEFDDEDMIAGLPPMVNHYTINGTGTFLYDGSTKTVSITRKENASPGAITILYNGTETPPVNVGTYTVTFNVAEVRGWSAANGLPAGTIMINRKITGAAVGVPTLNDATQNSITINPVDPPPSNGQTVEYGINTSNSAPSTWQTDLTFTGLSGGVYYIFARSAENDAYTAGATSVSQPVIIVTATGHWNTALSTIRNSGSGTIGNLKTYTIMVFGNVAVPGIITTDIIGDSRTSLGSAQYIAVTLKGSGTLSLDSSGSILRLGRFQTLIIDSENLTLQGYSGNDTAVVYLENDGALELKNGAISGNTDSGVYVLGNSTFTMSGGEISGNTATSSYGGGVYVGSFGAFTMNGGEITGNEAYIGGGVYMEKGNLTMMLGGEITGNTASYRGGGVYVSGRTFFMNDGKISGNTANSAFPASGGGGVYVDSDGTFLMAGGEISGNTAAFNGGGVYIISSSRFHITGGGVVYGSDANSPLANTAGSNGAALYKADPDSTAQYGLGTSIYDFIFYILPHTDGHPSYTNNTITGTPVPIAPGFVQEVLFTGQTEVINLDNLSRNAIYLVKVNTSNLVVSDANTGGAHAPSPGIQNTGKSSLPSGEALPRMGHPAADKFNANPPPIVQQPPRRQRAAFVPPVVGDTRSFWVENYFDSGVFVEKQATLMASGQYGNIWVMDENLNSGTSSRRITSARAQTLALWFDFIYPLETNLLGYEYGGGPGGDGGKDGDPKIQILIYDIVDTSGDVMAAGYFWGKDFYEDAELGGLVSNLAEIFYLDAWLVNRFPEYTYSTLVHEFQHMVNFNVKTVQNGQDSEAWYNEMLSMMTEDVIAPLIGIDPTNSFHVIMERMPQALSTYYLEGITEWGDLSLISYAKGFAFGAYLLRNYGGAELLQKILANNTTDIDSITSALNEFSNGLTFEQALKRYGEAMIFSGSPMPAGVMTFNKTVTSTINGFAYTAYGFDIWSMWNESGTSSGPVILDLSPMEMRPHSITVHSTNAWRGSGNFSITLERPIDPNVVLYLVVK